MKLTSYETDFIKIIEVQNAYTKNNIIHCTEKHKELHFTKMPKYNNNTSFRFLEELMALGIVMGERSWSYLV